MLVYVTEIYKIHSTHCIKSIPKFKHLAKNNYVVINIINRSCC
jgi:hypothetical protein